jgi:hypothetical protein
VRAIPSSDARIRTLPKRWTALRVTLSSNRNASAWDVELTNYGGRNWVKSFEKSETLDEALTQATVHLARDLWQLSLAPLVAGKLNRVDGSSVQLLKAVRLIRVETQLVPDGAAPNPDGEWNNEFEGYLSTITVSGDGGIDLVCRDRAAILQDAFIEVEQPPLNGASNWYTDLWPSDDPSATRTLEAVIQDAIDSTIMRPPDGYLMVYTSGESTTDGMIVRPSTRNGFCYLLPLRTDDFASSEPTWPTVIGETVTDDNGNIWTCYAELPTLYTPADSEFALSSPVLTGQQFWQREPLLDVLRRLAGLRGWDVKYRWDDGTSSWRLTLYDPRGDSSSVDTLSQSQFDVTSYAIDIAGVRNVVQVAYYVDGIFTRLDPPASDTDSLASYGRRFCELGEAASSQINSDDEASAFANAILGDLSQPWVLAEIELPYTPFYEIGDVLTLAGGHRYWTNDLKIAITSIAQMIGDGKATTKIKGREVVGVNVPAFTIRWSKQDPRVVSPIPALAQLPGMWNPQIPPGLKVVAYQTTDETLDANAITYPPSGADWASLNPINFDAVLTDPAGAYTKAANTDRTTTPGYFTAPKEGYYAISATVQIAYGVGEVDGTRQYLILRREGPSGDAIVGNTLIIPPSSGSLPQTDTYTVSASIGMRAGDTIKLYHLDENDELGGYHTVSGTSGTSLTILRVI